MQAMHPSNKPAFELPAGYGELVETLKVDGVPGLEGTLFVHVQKGVEGALVASLRLLSGGQQVTFKHLWEPKTPHTTQNGSTLLFRNAPNSQRSETWDSPSFRARHVEVFEGKYGPFAMITTSVPNPEDKSQDVRSPIKLVRREASPSTGFDAAGFQALAAGMRASAQANNPAPSPTGAAGPVSSVDDAVQAKLLAAVKASEGERGARWDDVLAAVVAGGIEPAAAESAINALMDKGQIYEPTLGILKTS